MGTIYRVTHTHMYTNRKEYDKHLQTQSRAPWNNMNFTGKQLIHNTRFLMLISVSVDISKSIHK